MSTVSGGQALLTTSLLPSGTRSLRAYYGGDVNYSPSTSAPVLLTVTAAVSLGFRSPLLSAVASDQRAAVTGDFNGDGKTDLAIANYYGANVSVLLGNGDGTFRSPVNYPTASYALSLVAADVNRDGKTDLIVGSQSVAYLLPGNGDGTFQAAQALNLGSSRKYITAADFNGDGYIDLAVANNSASNVAIALGNGDGTFQTGVNYATGPTPVPVVVADFNHDGKPDLAVVDQNGMSILAGNGNGTFQAALPVYASSSLYRLIAVDLNLDGNIDLAALSTAGFMVWLGNPDGTMQTGVTYAAASAGTIASGDFDGDGKPDLVLAPYYSAQLDIYLGTGSGEFQPRSSVHSVDSPSSLALGEFTGDARTDLVVIGTSQIGVHVGGAIPDLAITIAHGSGFVQGQTGATYSLSVSNTGDIETAGPVGVVGTLPPGMTAVTISGNGWTCVPATLACSRSDRLAPGASYPLIVIKVNISGGATGNLTAAATAAVHYDTNLTNNNASDTVFIRGNLPVTLTSSPNPAVLGQVVTLTASISSLGTGKVTFYDGTSMLGTAVLSGGTASITTTLLPSGSRALIAAYLGDTAYGPAVSPVRLQTVNANPANGLNAPVNYRLSTSSYGLNSMVVTDLNRDGKADLVAASSGSGSGKDGVTVSMGNGDGTFAAAVNYAPSLPVQKVAAGDVNLDGKMDLVLQGPSNALYLVLGNGDGTLQAHVPVAPGVSFADWRLADMNRDGTLDLVNFAGGTIQVLFNNGDGAFQTPVPTVFNGSLSNMIALADTNGDGVPDIIETNGGYGPPVRVFLGSADGTFALPVSYTGASTYVEAFTTGDFNGDGKVDVALVYWVGATVILGNGDGTFQAPIQSTFTAEVPGYQAISGDFNGDGKLDLAYASYVSGNLVVALGNGNGTFQSGSVIFTNGSSGTMTLAELNGDGRPDFLALNYSKSTVAVLLGGQFPILNASVTHDSSFTVGQTGKYLINISNATFTPISGVITVRDTLPVGLTASSISGTLWTCVLSTLTCTRSDALTTGQSYPPIIVSVNVSAGLPLSTVTNQVSITAGANNFSLNDPTLIVGPTSITLSVTAPTPGLGQAVTLSAIVTAGATGKVTFYDGGRIIGITSLTGAQASLTTRLLPAGRRQLRAVYGGDTTHAISRSAAVTYTGNASPSSGFATPATYAIGIGPVAVISEDLNRDGRPDLIVANSAANTVAVAIANGDGTFLPRVEYATGMKPTAVAAGDFDGDGKADLAVANQNSGTVSLLFGNGDGTLRTPVHYAAGESPSILAIGDFNGDGKTDLAASGTDSTLRIFFGNGDGSLRLPVVSNLSSVGTLAVDDLNGDGKADLISGGSSIYVWIGSGDGTFTGSYLGSLYSSSFALGDLNGDGNSDLVFSSYNGLSVYTGTAGGTFQSGFTYSLGLSPLLLSIADVNGDGKLDVIVTSSSSSNLTFYYGLGDGRLETAAPPTLPLGSAADALLAGDFNGDGRTDLAAIHNGNGSLSVVLSVLTPVLSVSSSHSSSGFFLGQSNNIFTLSVSNNGPGATSGLITLTDTLPPGLTGTAISGTGWTCVLGTLTCTRSDALAVGASYPPVYLMVSVTSVAPATVSNVSMVTGGGGVPGNAIDPTTLRIPPGVLTSPSGSGSFQTFTVTFTLGPNFGSLGYGQILFAVAPNGGGQSYCLLHFDNNGNGLWIYGDSGSFLGPVSPGVASSSLQNRACVVSTQQSSAVRSGSTVTLNIAVAFKAAFAGAKNIYVLAQDVLGNNTGFLLQGAWTVTAPADPVMTVTPNGGASSSQIFTVNMTDPAGFAGQPAGWAEMLFASAPDGGGQPFCLVHYDRAGNGLWLYGDGGFFVGPVTPGTPSTLLQSSACQIDTARSAGLNPAGLQLTVAVRFKGKIGGSSNVYLRKLDALSVDTGWRAAGSWTIPTSPSPETVTPIAPSGATQTFTTTFWGPYSSAYLQWAQMLFAVAPNGGGQPYCYVHYDVAGNGLWLYGDGGFFIGPVAPGTASSLLHTSACTLNTAAATVSTASGALVLNVPVTFQGSFHGTLNTYLRSMDYLLQDSNWQQRGTWVIP